jgi:proteic killer suppression protein
MKIGSVAHKGLRRFIERDDQVGLPAAFIERIRNIVSFLQDMEDVEELRGVPSWKVHQFAGDRKGTWSLTVKGKWRIMFQVDETENQIVGLNNEEYH